MTRHSDPERIRETKFGRLVLACVVVTAVGGCLARPPESPAPVPTSPGPTPSLSAEASPAASTGAPSPSELSGAPQIEPSPDDIAGAPPGAAFAFEKASLSPDKRTLTLDFTGGVEYDPANPRKSCGTRYAGWAREIDGVLFAKLVDTTPQADPGVSCGDIGRPRRVTIKLVRPFLGDRVRDLAGFTHFVARPNGLVDVQIPPGWQPGREGDVEESPTGRYLREWTRGAPSEFGSAGKIDLWQAFDGPVGVIGSGTEKTTVLVNGAPATLYRDPDEGELLLSWTLEGDGLALAVNEREIPIAELVSMAQSARKR